ncbi:MAG: hypothetical protein AAF384_19065 [Pseudomonadota bacterium]
MRNLVILSFVGIVTLGAQNSFAAFKCWKNEDGVRECGEKVPPKYAQQEYEERSKGGLTLNKSDRAKTMEELEVQREKDRQAELEKVAAKKRAADDRVLLDTFSSEDDILMTRDGQISHVESQIKITESHIRKLQRNLDQEIERAADFERRGKAPSEEVLANIENYRDQITAQQEIIDTKRDEQATIKARFDDDLNRFRSLKGLN